ncbi:hypothetical protein D3C79_772720 [compost metagenome]
MVNAEGFEVCAVIDKARNCKIYLGIGDQKIILMSCLQIPSDKFTFADGENYILIDVVFIHVIVSGLGRYDLPNIKINLQVPAYHSVL